ncbi:Uncharacterised protein [Serratia ficaria]|uniref:hypothetical protein n=1 Tax=Serratia ficaria TaxID=61651 RepID=UPI00217A5C5B|nr:hypothetical protein [Serratia ficaria]CAI1709789.1 Uncharacterised protein [Serratia ficaria]
MKLPRYLQIALALSALLCLWSFFSTSEEPPQEEPLLAQARPAAAAPHSRPLAAAAASAVNLFPFQGHQVEPPQNAAPSTQPKAVIPSTPPLPFQVSGAWWDRHQRALVLTDGERQWIVCRQCQARDKIWTGAILNHDWQLVEVGADFLTFRWLPQRHDRRLALGDMTFKPKF